LFQGFKVPDGCTDMLLEYSHCLQTEAIMLDETLIDRLTGLGRPARDALIRAYLRMNETSRIEIHARQTQVYTSWRNNDRKSGYVAAKKNEFAYAAFVLALALTKNEENKIPGTAAEADRQLEARLRRIKSQKKKSAGVKDLIDRRYYTEIVRMRDREESWRTIAAYAASYWKLRVSHTYLKRCVEEITAARELRRMAHSAAEPLTGESIE
jgi:hypothetical protein